MKGLGFSTLQGSTVFRPTVVQLKELNRIALHSQIFLQIKGTQFIEPGCTSGGAFKIKVDPWLM